MSRVVVIGAGLAGLTAATRLAAGGANVTLVSKGLGGLQLGQGTIDVLGYTPDRVTNPVLTLAAIASSRPEHPYAVIGAAGVHTAGGETAGCGEAGETGPDHDDAAHSATSLSGSGRCSTSRVPWKIQLSSAVWRTWSP